MSKKVYITKVTNYNLGDDEDPILAVEVPFAFIEDFDLKVNEILEWTIDSETRTATIVKKNVIINN